MRFINACVSGSIVAAYLVLGFGSHNVAPPLPNAQRDVAAFAASLPRKLYRYSVVMGGVYSPAELAAARRSDPVVAAHFADFGLNTMLVTLREDMNVYLSYRIGDKVYYSKRRHKVCKGEVLITDGKNYARTRCANRLTKVFKAPVLVHSEPLPASLDIFDPPDPKYQAVIPDPRVSPSDPIFSRIEDYSFPAPPPEQTGAAAPVPGQSGAAPVVSDYGPGSEVILPQFLPLAGVAPAFFGPAVNSGGSGGAGGGGGGGVLTPEPASSALLFSAALFALLLRLTVNAKVRALPGNPHPPS